MLRPASPPSLQEFDPHPLALPIAKSELLGEVECRLKVQKKGAKKG